MQQNKILNGKNWIRICIHSITCCNDQHCSYSKCQGPKEAAAGKFRLRTQPARLQFTSTCSGYSFSSPPPTLSRSNKVRPCTHPAAYRVDAQHVMLC